MSDTISVPLRIHKNEKWGALDCWSNRQIDVVAERWKKVEENFSFIGGHRQLTAKKAKEAKERHDTPFFRIFRFFRKSNRFSGGQ